MIIIECAWCDGELALEAIDATSVDCPDCGISLDIAPDDSTTLLAAAGPPRSASPVVAGRAERDGGPGSA
jgi:hypothetical protein